MKSNREAEKFFIVASENLAEKNFIEALKNFNRCLLYAETNSQVYSNAFIGRASVYFEVKEFKLSRQNCQSAISECIDDRKLHTLEKQNEDCDEISQNIAQEKMTKEFFAFAQPAHKKIPFIAESLEVREDEVYGRFIATTKDLSPGDIVVMEEPFYKVVDAEQRHERCAVCLKQNKYNLFPCGKCCDALFCSEECKESVVHGFECGAPREENITDLLLQRMLHQSIDVAGSLEDLQMLMKHQEGKTIMEFDFSDPENPLNNKHKVLATTGLTERGDYNDDDSAKFESIFKKLSPKNDDQRAFLQDFLRRCRKSITVNFFHFFWSPDEPVGHGYALCLLAAYFAHSCDPNVEKIDVDNKFVFVVRKPIKAGEKLFMNYDRYSFLTHSLKERRDYFNEFYTFECACNACVNDFKKLEDLPKFDDNFELSPEPDSIENAKNIFRENCNYIKKHIERYPSFEVCSLMIQNYRLLHVIGNKLEFS